MLTCHDIKEPLCCVGVAHIAPFSNSVAMGVMAAYPEHLWRPWKFARGAPVGWWREVSQLFHSGSIEGIVAIREYMEDLAEQHNIGSLADWQRLTRKLITSTILSHINQLGGLDHVLKILHPNHDWSVVSQPSDSQGQLHHHANLLFPTKPVSQ